MTPMLSGGARGAIKTEMEVWEEVFERGAAPIETPLPKAVWERLYSALSTFAEFVAKHEEYGDLFDTTAKAWQAESQAALQFSGYFSPYYRNRIGQAGKDQKIIFQICEPYFRYLAERQPALLSVSPFARLVEGSLAALYAVYASVIPLVSCLRNVNSGFLSAILPRYEMPPIAIRLLRYQSDSRFFTNPHVDKSAITVIANTDDPADDACLVFAPPKPGVPLLSEFAPIQKRGDQSVLFLGAAAREAGFDGFTPAPHAVRPSREPRVRHSAIFFWLLPGIDLKLFSTDVPFTDDIGVSRGIQPRRAS